jgi:phosphoglucosamine mutase
MGCKKERLFGTDGIRGLANHGALEMKRVLMLGEATACLLARKLKPRARVGLGWDSRISSPGLAAALTAGLTGGGAHVWRFGVITTPAVSRLVGKYRLDAGIVVSASHNPAEDNGIKYFSSSGGKFPDEAEQKLEKIMSRPDLLKPMPGVSLGMVRQVEAKAASDYIQDVIRRFANARLAGLRVVADLAQGAACRTVPGVMEGLKIRAQYMADKPNGLNINLDCGSLHPDKAASRIRALKSQAGLAFDGDGDRVMLVDEKGNIINGDRMMGLLATYYARQGRLAGRTVVATVMSNLGLELFLKQKNIRLLRTKVGDRYVSQVLAERGLILGGEQSGHLLLPRMSPTGDGLLTALEVLRVMRAEGKPLSELAGGWKDFPQRLVNVRVTSRPQLDKLSKVKQEVTAAQRILKERGRINLRYSGTEPLARIMVEAENASLVETWSNRIADAVEQSIGNGKGRTTTWLTCA